MTALTHQRAGLFCGLITHQLIITTQFDSPNFVSYLFLTTLYCTSTMIGSLVPDLDMRSSQLSKLIPFLSRLITKRFKHRTFTHSFLSIGVYLLILALSVHLNVSRDIFSLIVIGLCIGHISHIILDLFTNQGVCLLYPLTYKIKVASFKTGGKAEHVISQLIMVAITGYFVYETYQFIIFLFPVLLK